MLDSFYILYFGWIELTKTSSFFWDPEELPSQNPTAVVALATAAPTVNAIIVLSFIKKLTPNATTNVNKTTKETIIDPKIWIFELVIL